jgi:hypothetical protein
MKTAIFACNTIRDELLLAEQKVQSGYEIFWLESNLHNFPDKLRTQMQVQLDSLEGYDRVLMAFGFCGNSVLGLRTHSFEMILPRVDDCITLMIGSIEKRAKLSFGHHSIYLTKGWLEHEANIWSEYEYTAKKYGEKTAQYVIDVMYGNYDTLSLVDTGAYSISSVLERARRISEKFGLGQNIIPGTTLLIEQLLAGPWDTKVFLVIPPYSSVEANDVLLI